jgi:RNA polymerase sigma-B factor
MRVGNVRKLTEEDIQDLLAQYARRPDARIRDDVVLQYANLVESIARRFLGACEPLDDLVQEGYIGLIRSVDKYDVNMGVKFSTYATHFIIGEIKHYLRDKGKIIKEPAWLQELNQRMTRVIESLNQKFGRQPTEKEIAEVMQMPEATVRDLLTTREVFKVSSLDGDKDDSPTARDSEKIKDQKVFSFQLPVEDKIVLETALERLKDIERQVIAAHFYKGLNQTEIARQLGISCNYVSHILRNGTKKLRKILTTEEIRDTQMQRTLTSLRARQGEAPVEPSSVIDSTTGVYNREYFVERLDEELSRAYRENYKVAVVLVEVCLPEELDRYVRMIRTDDVLYTVAQNVRESVRKMDLVSRFGATAFALMLPHTAGHASVVADRIAGIISSIEIDAGCKGKGLTAGARVGIARYPADASSSDHLIRKAAENLGSTVEELTGASGEGRARAA